MSTTASIICTGALGLLGVMDPEDTPTAAMLADAFRRLNLMMGSWSLQHFTIPSTGREVFPTIAGKGTPSNPYTVGLTGDLVTTRPTDLLGAGLLLMSSTPPVEIPRAVLTDDAYEAIRIKNLQSTLWTSVYYNATFAAGLGQLFLYPVPDNNFNSLVLYRREQLGLFASQTASYDLPEGADEAVEYNLAKRLLDVYSVDAQRKANVLEMARSSLAIYKRSNVTFTDQPVDPMFLIGGRRRRGYNLQTGEGG